MPKLPMFSWLLFLTESGLPCAEAAVVGLCHVMQVQLSTLQVSMPSIKLPRQGPVTLTCVDMPITACSGCAGRHASTLCFTRSMLWCTSQWRLRSNQSILHLVDTE